MTTIRGRADWDVICMSSVMPEGWTLMIILTNRHVVEVCGSSFQDENGRVGILAKPRS